MRQEVRGDADAVVGNTLISARSPASRSTTSIEALFGREFHRIRQQVDHHLLQPRRIAAQRAARARSRTLRIAMLLWPRRPAAPSPPPASMKLCVLQRTDVEPQLARSDAAQVEQVLDQLGLDLDALLDHLQPPIEFFGAAAPSAACGPSPRMAPSGLRNSCATMARNSSLLRAHAFGLGACRPLAFQQCLRAPRPSCRLASYRRALSMATPACAATPTTSRSLRAREDARVGMAEEQPADHLAGARHHRHGQVAAHRQVTGRHPVVRSALAVARVGRHVVDPHRPFAAEGRLEQRRHARLTESRKRIARSPRER